MIYYAWRSSDALALLFQNVKAHRLNVACNKMFIWMRYKAVPSPPVLPEARGGGVVS
jgi:hypothetical protein